MNKSNYFFVKNRVYIRVYIMKMGNSVFFNICFPFLRKVSLFDLFYQILILL